MACLNISDHIAVVHIACHHMKPPHASCLTQWASYSGGGAGWLLVKVHAEVARVDIVASQAALEYDVRWICCVQDDTISQMPALTQGSQISHNQHCVRAHRNPATSPHGDV